jgi:hypothetical protein
VPSWPNAIGRIARTISAIAEMRVGFLCIRLDGRPIWWTQIRARKNAFLHTQSAFGDYLVAGSRAGESEPGNN